MIRRRRARRREELARAAARVLRDRENRRIARRDPQRLGYMIADEILATGQPWRPPKQLAVVPVLALAAFPAAKTQHRNCRKTFTVRMAERLARYEWPGTRTPSEHDWKVLLYLARCQRNRMARPFVHRYYQHQARLNAQRRYDAAHPVEQILASWYDDAGATASGAHYTYGFASCGSMQQLCVPFGTRVEFFYHGHDVIAQRQDSGPYAGSRGVDLNQGLAGALGFDGVDTVGYRILG